MRKAFSVIPFAFCWVSVGQKTQVRKFEKKFPLIFYGDFTEKNTQKISKIDIKN